MTESNLVYVKHRHVEKSSQVNFNLGRHTRDAVQDKQPSVDVAEITVPFAVFLVVVRLEMGIYRTQGVSINAEM